MKLCTKQIIKTLELEPHPEGGFYKEVIRSDKLFNRNMLPNRYSSSHNLYTSIYFLIDNTNPSTFHKLKSDELWFFLLGNSLSLHLIDNQGKLNSIKMGQDITDGDNLQFKIPHDTWIAAETNGDFSLIACNVIPGFEFNDFKLADKMELINKYPEHSEIIERLTND